MTGPLVQALDLTVERDGVAVVRDLDLSVAAGELVVLTGPNGVGKTTTVSALAGLLPVAAGTLEVLGVPLAGRGRTSSRVRRLVRRGLAFVPDDRGLFPSLTARENIRLAVPRRRGASAVDLAVAAFPLLGDVLDRRCGLLSGGEQQALALGRALATEPELLVVDELSAGLAPQAVQRLVTALDRARTDSGAGILVVDPDADRLATTADRVARLDPTALGGPTEAGTLTSPPQSEWRNWQTR